MTARIQVSPGNGRSALIVIAHADDLAFRCGGAAAVLVDARWQVVAARVTDDATDSDGLSPEETTRRNHAEFGLALGSLGVQRRFDLGFPSDQLGGIDERLLRRELVRLIREIRPYLVITFDSRRGPGEDNEDHVLVGAASAEACWTAAFDKHEGDQLDAGLSAHAVFERWTFARFKRDGESVLDISAALDRKLDAVSAHPTMLANMERTTRLMASTGGVTLPAGFEVDASMREVVRRRAKRVGSEIGSEAGEAFAVSQFSELGEVAVQI